MLRPVPPTRAVAALLVALALALGCGEGQHGANPPAVREASAPLAAPTAAPAAAAQSPKRADPNERPLPAFDGTTLDGQHFEASSLLGRRALLFLFNPTVREAEPAAQAVAHVARLRD